MSLKRSFGSILCLWSQGRIGFIAKLRESGRTEEGGKNLLPQGPNQGKNMIPGREKTQKKNKNSPKISQILGRTGKMGEGFTYLEQLSWSHTKYPKL
jgi:hypothetical protein